MSTTDTFTSQTFVIQASAINDTQDNGWVIYNTFQNPPNSINDAKKFASFLKVSNPTKVVQLNSFTANITNITDTISSLH